MNTNEDLRGFFSREIPGTLQGPWDPTPIPLPIPLPQESLEVWELYGKLMRRRSHYGGSLKEILIYCGTTCWPCFIFFFPLNDRVGTSCAGCNSLPFTHGIPHFVDFFLGGRSQFQLVLLHWRSLEIYYQWAGGFTGFCP